MHIPRRYTPSLLGFSHFLNDFTGGFLISMLGGSMIESFFLFLMTYNGLAFVFQVPMGVMIDTWGDKKRWIQIGLMLSILALGSSYLTPWLAIILSGLGSSIFHVSGGALLGGTDKKKHTFDLGVFTAPGVFGVTLGTVLGLLSTLPLLFIPILLVIAIVFLQLVQRTASAEQAPVQINRGISLSLLFLTLGIALRSGVWIMMQPFAQTQISFLLICAAFAALGKIFGGYMGEHVSGKISVPLLHLGSIPMLLLGILYPLFLPISFFLLEASTPILLERMQAQIPTKLATMTGLALGLAIGLGGATMFLSPHMPLKEFLDIISLLLIGSSVLSYLGICSQELLNYSLKKEPFLLEKK